MKIDITQVLATLVMYGAFTYVAILYYRQERFACRVCQTLAYRTENLDRVQRLWAAQARLESRLGNDLKRQKGMHEKTFRKFLATRRKTIETQYRLL